MYVNSGPMYVCLYVHVYACVVGWLVGWLVGWFDGSYMFVSSCNFLKPVKKNSHYNKNLK